MTQTLHNGNFNDVVLVRKDKAGEWRWVHLAGNHHQVSSSGESFANRFNAIRSAKRANPTTRVVVQHY